MSSASSIDDAGRELPVTADVRAAGAAADGFRPWHFFLLMSLVLATAAVIVSRRSTPEHLILISIVIASAGAAAAGFYRMIAPLASADESPFREPLTERTRQALEREKTLTLRAIKELEFDRAMGKMSDRDFDEMGGRLRARAISIIRQLDEDGGRAGHREAIEREVAARVRQRTAAPPVAASAACACGTMNDPDAAFCKRCGTRLATAGGS